jgi:hypothetical protein
MLRAEPSGRGGAPARAVAAWQPWAALATIALPLHFAWEMMQAPLFDSMNGLGFARGTWVCARSSLADLALSLVSYGVAAVVQGTRAWLLRPRPIGIAVYFTIGIASTVVIELLAVYHGGRWSYAPAMPRVAGIGLAPLLQWVIVPMLTLWVARRYLQRGRHHTHPGERR